MPLPVGWTLAVLAMSLFGSLGAWQWGRAEQKQAMLADTARILAERVRKFEHAEVPQRRGGMSFAHHRYSPAMRSGSSSLPLPLPLIQLGRGSPLGHSVPSSTSSRTFSGG